MSTEDPIAGLHRRFDKFEANFKEVQDAQQKLSMSAVALDNRIDLVEMQIRAADQREVLVIKALENKLDNNSNLIRKMFEKFDRHTERETEDRKKLLFWLITTAVSVLGTAGTILFNAVFLK